MTEVVDRTKRRCAICRRADLPAYAYVNAIPACCYECLTALAAAKIADSSHNPSQENHAE